jgi:hypothetical protein
MPNVAFQDTEGGVGGNPIPTSDTINLRRLTKRSRPFCAFMLEYTDVLFDGRKLAKVYFGVTPTSEFRKILSSPRFRQKPALRS